MRYRSESAGESWWCRFGVRSLLGAVVVASVGAGLLGPVPGAAHEAAASVPQTVPGAAAGGGLVLAQAGGFDDVADGAYYSAAVEALAAAGVFEGTECGPGLLCPDDPIDRKTMAVWAVRVVTGEDPPAVSESRFSDVDAQSIYGPFVERMAELEITQGCGGGTRFCPDDTVTRAQMAVFLSRAFSLADGPDPGFSDVPDGAWYGADAARLAHSGITKGCGDGTVFCPAHDTTRAQMAAFLHRAIVRGNQPEPEPASVVLAGLPGTATVAASAGQIRVSWPAADPVGGSDVAGYEVQWHSGGQGWDDQRRRVVVGLTYVIGGLGDGTEYTVRVRPAAVESARVQGASIVAGEGSSPTAEIVGDAPALPSGYRSASALAGPVDFDLTGAPVWPVTISIPVDMDLVGEDSVVQIVYYNEGLEAWVPEASVVLDRELGVVTAEVYHLSFWQAVVGAARAQSGSVSHGPISWQSAGDSYSSGQGLSERQGPCARSRLAYGPEAVREAQCPGVGHRPRHLHCMQREQVTEQYFNNWSTPWGPSVPETIAICGGNPLCLSALPRGTHTIGSQWRQGLDQGGPERVDIIVMSFGGNDIGFGDVIFECVVSLGGCDISEQEVESRINDLVDPPAECLGPRYELSGSPRYECDLDLGTSRGSIVDFYESIVTDRLSSRGKLFVVGYPRLFAPVEEWPEVIKIGPVVIKIECQAIGRGDTEKLGRLAKHLNDKLIAAVDAANSRLGSADRIHYLDLLSLYRDNKAELCGTNQDWLDGWRAPPNTTCCSFHPNATGHYKTATKLADLIAQEWPAAVCPPPTGQATRRVRRRRRCLDHGSRHRQRVPSGRGRLPPGLVTRRHPDRLRPRRPPSHQGPRPRNPQRQHRRALPQHALCLRGGSRL